MKLGNFFLWMTFVASIGCDAAAARCVSNDSELADALSDARSTKLAIQIVQGTYHLGNTVWHNAPQGRRIASGSSLLGGYTANCAGRDIEVNNTTFVDSLSADDGPDVFDNLLIEGITFKLRFSLGPTVSNSFSPKATIRRSAFLGGGNLNLSQVDDPDDPGGSFTATIENVLIAGNDYNGHGCGLGVQSITGRLYARVINSTVADNLGNGGICAGHLGGNNAAVLEIYNSIVYGNSGADIVNDSSETELVNVLFHTHSYPTPDFPPIDSINADPQLTSDYHLTEPSSPAIDAGTSNVPGGLPSSDLDGGARVIGNAVDLGAFESSIDSAYSQVVINTNDSGTGSLRQAMLNAIAHGSGKITFDIGSGCGPHVITLQSELPDLTVPMLIRGYSQTGASKNTLDYGFDAKICIVIKAANDSVTYAFRVPPGAPANTQVTIEGFDFGGFGTSAVALRAGSGHIIDGNRFGVINGSTEDPQPYDIFIDPGVHDVVIGGDDAGDRNLILTATSAGIGIDDDATGHAANKIQIVNNYIGMGWSVDHLVPHGNTGDGIRTHGYSNTIRDNFIGYGGGDGIVISGTLAHDNVVIGNTIGGTSTDDGNAGNGVTIQSDANDNRIDSNTIDYNGARGVRIVNGLRNRITKTFIAGNGALGIDLAGLGVTGNDDDANPPAPDYANRGQNFPTPTGAIGGHFRGIATGTLTTTPGDYTIEVFGTFTCDSSGHGEGAPFLASRRVNVPLPTTGDQNTKNWSIPIESPGAPLLRMPPLITATATDAAGNTSEFSTCEPYIDDTIFADGFDPVILF